MSTRRFLFLFIIGGCAALYHNDTLSLSSLARNDAFPMFTPLDPHSFLLDRCKLHCLDVDWAEEKKCHMNISFSPFAQNANEGKTLAGKPTPQEEMMGTEPDQFRTELGDLMGKTSMIALTYGAPPAGEMLPASLLLAKNKIFINPTGGTELQPEFPIITSGKPTDVINDDRYIDNAQKFGFFSFPLKYRKRGIRFEINAQFLCDFGFKVQTGVSSIRQIVLDTINETDQTSTQMPMPQEFFPNPVATDCPPNIARCDVNQFLMEKLDNIAKDIKVDICDFIETSIEEIRLSLYWRHVFEINEDRDHEDWPHALIIPFIQATGSFSPGKVKDPSKLFGVFFGNNGHNAVGFTSGINVDFLETIEIGGEVGYTHFFDQDFRDFRIPNSCFQTNIYPFTADIEIKPGSNWHFGGKIAAYHFLGMLSMYFQYIMVEHKEDSIKLKVPDPSPNPAFVPGALAKRTSFKTKLANIGFTYDIAPNVALGFLWQAPLSQRNTYRSTTIMFSFIATF